MIDWIEIKDIKDAPDDEVLVKNKYNDFMIGYIYFDKDMECLSAESDVSIIYEVTHYALLE